MSVIIKNLGSGTITSITAKTVGPPTGKSWLVKSVILTNRDTVVRTINAQVTGGTSPNNAIAYIAPPSMAIAASSTVALDSEITLQYPTAGTQEIITLTAPVAPSTGIDFVLNGIERDIV